MCGFCHAPEHAYAVLLEDASLSRNGLCHEAQERLLMAATPYPDEVRGQRTTRTHYEWDEQARAWEAVREWGTCTECGEITWRAPQRVVPHMCASCTERARVLHAQLCMLVHGRPLTEDEREALDSLLPCRSGLRVRGRLRFSDYPVNNTRCLESVMGPRSHQRRPTSHEIEWLTLSQQDATVRRASAEDAQ